MVSPVNEPLTDFVSAAVGEGVGVFVTALFVAVELLDEVFEALELLEVLDDEVALFEEAEAEAFLAALLLVPRSRSATRLPAEAQAQAANGHDDIEDELLRLLR